MQQAGACSFRIVAMGLESLGDSEVRLEGAQPCVQTMAAGQEIESDRSSRSPRVRLPLPAVFLS